MGRKATRSFERERTGKEGEETPPLYEEERKKKEESDERGGEGEREEKREGKEGGNEHGTKDSTPVGVLSVEGSLDEGGGGDLGSDSFGLVV